MSNPINLSAPLSEFILYTTPNGDIKLEVFFHEENIWLTQKKMAELFGVTPQKIATYLKNIYDSGELQEEATCKENLQVQKEGENSIKRVVKLYSLEVIISVGYRINSSQATQFRVRATKILNENYDSTEL